MEFLTPENVFRVIGIARPVVFGLETIEQGADNNPPVRQQGDLEIQRYRHIAKYS